MRGGFVGPADQRGVMHLGLSVMVTTVENRHLAMAHSGQGAIA